MEQSRDHEEVMEEVWERKFSCRYLVSERHEITNLVRCRMDNLELPSDDYRNPSRIRVTVSLWCINATKSAFSDYQTDKRGTISYVILNPSYDLALEPGDVM